MAAVRPLIAPCSWEVVRERHLIPDQTEEKGAVTSPCSLLAGLLGPQVGKPGHGVRVSVDILGWQLQDMPHEFNIRVPGGRSTWAVLVSKPLSVPPPQWLCSLPLPHTHVEVI